jgi:drug/metabolite transporter (DMT)-like permease
MNASPQGSAASATTSADTAVTVGIGLMLLGVLMFSLNDVMGKWLVATYSVGQILLLRSAAALLLLSPLIWRAGKEAFREAPRPGLQLVRVILGTAEVAMFYWSVAYLPLADVTTYYLAGPIYVTAISAVFLKEPVGWRRWSAVLVGFAGVLIALNPSPDTLTWPAVIALAGSVFYALLLTTTRALRGTSEVVMISTQIASSLVFGLFAAPFGWVTPSGRDLLLLGLLGIVAMGALSSINRSLRLAAASVVVPYQYTMIVWAVIFGWTFFGDRPQAHTLIGSAIIVAAGLFIFFREQRTARAGEPAVTPPRLPPSS